MSSANALPRSSVQQKGFSTVLPICEVLRKRHKKESTGGLVMNKYKYMLY